MTPTIHLKGHQIPLANIKKIYRSTLIKDDDGSLVAISDEYYRDKEERFNKVGYAINFVLTTGRVDIHCFGDDDLKHTMDSFEQQFNALRVM